MMVRTRMCSILSTHFLNPGFVIADDTGMRRVLTTHFAASNASDNIQQWFNSGGQLQFYDYPLSQYRSVRGISKIT